jgi:hypothetical protein
MVRAILSANCHGDNLEGPPRQQRAYPSGQRDAMPCQLDDRCRPHNEQGSQLFVAAFGDRPEPFFAATA